MPASSASQRLNDVLQKFSYKKESLVETGTWNRYRAKLPSGLPINFTPLNPVSFLLKAAQTVPNKIALEYPERGRKWTFGEWADRIGYLVYALLDSGLQRGDVVAVLSPNTAMIADCLQAVPAARCIVNTINNRLTKDEVKYILDHSGAKMLFIDSEFAHLSQVASIPTIICKGEEGDEYEQFLSRGRQIYEKNNQFWGGIELEKDENAGMALCYTSGTTGRPKGCLTTFRGSYLAALSGAFENRLNSDSRLLWILPMFHCAGWCFGWSSAATMATQVCLRGVGDYTEIWNQLRNGITHYCGAPTVHLGIVNHPKAQRLSTPVKCFVAGAAPTPTLIKGLNSLNIDVIAVYGLSETYGPCTRNYHDIVAKGSNAQNDEESEYRSKARQGKAFLNADEVLVVNQTDGGGEKEHEVPWDGETNGEICMRGNIVMKEYFKDPKATAEAFRGGYFHSGDIAVRMPDGTISITDRSKDIIISGGENASSLKIEAEIAAHPDVAEVAVIGKKDEKFGERPMAFVILKGNGESKWNNKEDAFMSELQEFCRNRLPGFALPRWLRIVKELPKTSTGKVQKNVLRKTVN